MELWEEFANLERHNVGERIPDAPKTSCEGRRSTDRASEYDGATIVVALLSAAAIFLAIAAGLVGLWVGR
jgi:hypothetical protein